MGMCQANGLRGIAMTDPVYADLDAWEQSQEQWLSMRPVCDICGEHIQDDTAMRICLSGINYTICNGCIKDHEVDID